MIKAPKSKYQYFFGQEMFVTIWNVFLLLTLFFFLMAVKHFFNSNPNLYTFIAASGMSFVSLVILKKTGKYNIPAMFGSFFGSFFCLYSIVFVGDHSALADLLWVMLVSVFAIYTLGTLWGSSILFLNITGIVWRYIGFENSVEYSFLGNVSGYNTLINIVVATLTLTYLIHRITQASVFANRDFEKANEKLHIQNDLLEAKSKEKTVLLQEVHHRVKNNLQVISSLIRLQSYETENLKAKELFETSVNRIQAMSLIHSKMYQGDNLSKINLEEYLNDLAKDIFRSYSTDTAVSFVVKSELEVIGNRTIVPLSLIFNELITNSLKHAFKNIDKGEVKLIIKLKKDNKFTLDYYDTGVWVDNNKPKSFGIELIETFTEQLDGTVVKESNEKGTHYSFCLTNID